MIYIETDCTIEHQGRTFKSGGAAVTPDRCVAYLSSKGSALTDWHGHIIGTYRVVSSWSVRGYITQRMLQVEATVDGIGMVYVGKRKAQQPKGGVR
jgi:hypothetical protein